jgi:phosphoribosylanthranilate isomerase
MWIKICANTNAEDALAAAELGADAVGFVFAPSARQVTVEQVRAISDVMPEGVERVGVFACAPVEEIAMASEQARLNTVQLHGGFDQEFSRRLQNRLGPGVSLIQTLHWNLGEDEDSLARLTKQFQDSAKGGRVLLDSKTGSASGGTGKSFPWKIARKLLVGNAALRVIAAGGLRPENVAEAVRTIQPWGVDVASGVEAEPGKKDRRKLEAFIRNAREA